MPVQMPDETQQGGYPGALQQAAQPVIMPGYGGSDPQSMIMQALSTMPRRAAAPPSPATQALTNLSSTLLSDTKALPSALERAAATRDQATAEKMAAIQRAMGVLSGLDRNSDQRNQLALGAGFLAPTKTGQFGESLGNAASGLLAQQTAQRGNERENALDIAKLALQKAGIPEDAAEDTVKDAMRRMQLGSNAAQQASLSQWRDETGAARAAAANRQHVKYLGPSKDDPTKGLYLNADTNEVTYGPLVGSTQKPMTANEAGDNASKDFEILYPKPEFGGQRVLPPEGLLAWKKKRMAAYARGDADAIREQDEEAAAVTQGRRGSSPAAAQPAPAAARQAQPAPAQRGGPPQRPAGVPASAKFSPSQGKWYWQENGQWMAR